MWKGQNWKDVWRDERDITSGRPNERKGDKVDVEFGDNTTNED